MILSPCGHLADMFRNDINCHSYWHQERRDLGCWSVSYEAIVLTDYIVLTDNKHYVI